ncbi:hypothetical protein DFQ28_002789 [Apophysomyces sp. BC1034]|nr:hypothetical protein DFQ29_002067 [Apophysomyces sp. BC1021]KAG0189872.1 hypothetical protein DFQ28_002789 [Apophysomyces sp. BC1034]
MDGCLQRQPTRLFWWSLGYEDNEEMKQVYKTCSSDWTLWTIQRYYRHLKHAADTEIGEIMEHVDVPEKRASPPPAYTPAADSVEKERIQKEMYQQRQKLYEEIAKRRRARNSLNRHSIAGIHPLDSTLQKDDNNHGIALAPPPPPPPAVHPGTTAQIGWHAPDRFLSETPESGSRASSFSSEKMDYDLFRAKGKSKRPSISVSSIEENHAAPSKAMSSRRRNKKKRMKEQTSAEQEPMLSVDHYTEDEETTGLISKVDDDRLT